MTQTEFEKEPKDWQEAALSYARTVMKTSPLTEEALATWFIKIIRKHYNEGHEHAYRQGTRELSALRGSVRQALDEN